MVPRQKELQCGTPVSIILKSDQRSGKLTSGRVQDILTKGDHPRGIKVRLSNGQIGRVQSLGVSRASMPHANIATASSFLPLPLNVPEEQSGNGALPEPPQAEANRWPNPAQSTSLMDYVKPNNSRLSSKQEVSMSLQERLERKFPELDPSLIAAILPDYPTSQAAERVLYALCTT
ncbi:MAG: hypothetical protein L6R38_007903 [Xanthoria sp. 2 TBL-2021]|nr:MAG: hypothetical protein L6R38_007903 [Xanthoria sp. 2 TBL-2021]